MNGDEPRFYGKYRGKVTHNADTDGLGRIQATVLEVYGTNDSPWALPSVPYAGNLVGLMLIPPVGAWVWFEFEHGNPNTPIWSGCFWETGQAPAPAATPTTKVLQTDTVTITIDDQQPGQGSITIETDAGCHLSISGNSIEIANGQGKIAFSAKTVSVNDGALEVT